MKDVPSYCFGCLLWQKAHRNRTQSEVKVSDIFKTMLGTKEGIKYVRKELKKFEKDVCKAAKKHLFGGKKGGKKD